MTDSKRENFLPCLAATDFFGREPELATILTRAKAETPVRGLLVSGAPGAGVSELLKQAGERLFEEDGEVIPFYFSVRKSDRTARRAATRFMISFLQQAVAFRRRDPRIIASSADVCEIAALAPPSDGHWIDRLIESCSVENVLNDDVAFVRGCLSAPLRAVASGVKIFTIVDNLHEAAFFEGDVDFTDELGSVFARSGVPFAFGAHRRFSVGACAEELQTLHIAPLGFADAGALAASLASNSNVVINDQTRDLLAVQFGGNPRMINLMIRAAAEKETPLDSFQNVEKIYVDEIFGGRISRYFDSVLNSAAPATEIQKQLLGLLFDHRAADGKIQIEAWQSRAGLAADDFARIMQTLNAAEFVRLTSNLVESMDDDRVLGDYIQARFRLEILRQNRALTVGEALTDFLKRAPQLMADYYRRRSAIGLREILGVFDCQEVPAALLDYGRFRDELKGAPDAEILSALNADTDRVTLPQIVYTAHTVSFYPQFARVVERERSAVALGFIESKYTDDDEIVWIAAEIDSKLEAKKELTEFWCDRLEMVALMCNFQNYRIWLVAPEGFAPDALEVLRSREAFGSSRKQVGLLAEFLGAAALVNSATAADEYEMVVPMGDDTELIAAQTVEEIARRHNFTPKAINQIKTALVEACINASEHSLSPDRRIYQKFSVSDDRLTITIANRGLRIADKQAREVQTDEGRRGWGLKLMRNLMDDVRFEQTDDGTRISMTKMLK